MTKFIQRGCLVTSTMYCSAVPYQNQQRKCMCHSVLSSIIGIGIVPGAFGSL